MSKKSLKNIHIKKIPDDVNYNEDYMQDDTYDDYDPAFPDGITVAVADGDDPESYVDDMNHTDGKGSNVRQKYKDKQYLMDEDEESEELTVDPDDDDDIFNVSDIDDEMDRDEYIPGTKIRKHDKNGKVRFIAKVFEYLDGTRDEHIPAFAAQSAFFLFLSFFPIISLVLTFTDIFPFTKEELLRLIYQVIPADFEPLIYQIVDDIYKNASSSVAIISLVIALWSAAKGFMAIRNGLNEVYRSRDTRNYVVSRSISMIYTAVFIVIIVVLILLNIFGRQIAGWLIARYPESQQVTVFVYSFRSIASFVVVFVLLVLLYTFIPNRKLHLMRQIAGAMFAALAWVGIARVFSLVVDNFIGNSSVYGSLTTLVLIMIWLYYVSLMIFIGAMVNEFIYEYYYRDRKKRKRA